MDLLHVRYADPYAFLNEVIKTRQFHEFIMEIASIISEERKQETLWQFFLHKVFDKTYEEFINEIEEKENESSMDEDDIKKIIQNSTDLLDYFLI